MKAALRFALGTLATAILRLALAALFFTAAAPRLDAVILMVVLEPLTLFEIEGIDFASYATSERATIRVEDTADGFAGQVELRGQTEPRGSLTLLAVSVADPLQQVRLELDTQPLHGPPHPDLTTLETRPVPIEPPPVTDRALEPFADPLFLGFRFVSAEIDPQTGATRSTYHLERLDVPEPSSLLLSALGYVLLACRRNSRRAVPP
jgi:PEP-CTERM motif